MWNNLKTTVLLAGMTGLLLVIGDLWGGQNGMMFALVLAAGDQSLECPHAALWRIPLPKDNRALREYLSLRMVASRTSETNPADVPLLALLKERMARAAPAAVQAALEALYAGEFSDAGIRVDPSIRQVRRFDRLLEISADKLLEERYPRFREVAPRKILPSPRLYQQVLEGFVVPGTLPLAEARSRALSTLIDGLATPLGLVEIKRNAYVFSPDASGYPLIPHLLSLVSASGPTPVPRVFEGLEGSPFGLPHDTAVFLIAALVVGGLLGARKSGRAIPLDYLSLQSVENADEITLGELIAEADRETLVRECAFLPSVAGVESFGLRQQREAWKEVIKFRDTSVRLSEGVRNSLARMAEFSSFKTFGLANLERTLTAVSTLAESIKVSYPAKDGLQSFLRAWRGTGLTGAEVLSLGKLSRFLTEKAEQFIFITHYLRHPAVEKAASREERIAELRATALALLESPEAGVVNDGGEHLSAVFAQIREAYGALYARGHAAFYQARQAPALSRSAQRALEVLRLLSAIEALDRPAGLEAFLNELSRGEREQCKRRLSEELLRSPLCGCGFALGDSPAPARSESPEEAIDRFLLAYCEILGSPRVIEPLAARAFALQDVKASSAERLKRLADILRRGAVSPAELAGAIDEGTASELGRALSGRIPIRSRSLAELNAKLSGRRLPARTILAMVTEWLSEASEDALIAVEPDRAGGGAAGGAGAAPGGPGATSFWPLFHGDLFARRSAPLSVRPPSPGASSADEIPRWESALEETFPSTRLREAFLATDQSDLFRFISEERLHTAAIRAAWLVFAERTLSGRALPSCFTPTSLHAHPERARHIEGLLKSLARAESLLGMPYPERLAVRISFEELLFDPWTTEELAAALQKALDKIALAADSWIAGIAPVQPIELADLPVVLIADGVPADVWMQVIEKGWADGELAGAEMSWARLESVPRTQESIASLLALTGDPQEQLWLRDMPLLNLKGTEEISLKERLLPLAESKPVIARLTFVDQAAHARKLRLSEMAAVLIGILGRDLPAVLRECGHQKRPLILTTDHGLSLSRDGLSHGRGGAYERLIFRARWAFA